MLNSYIIVESSGFIWALMSFGSALSIKPKQSQRLSMLSG